MPLFLTEAHGMSPGQVGTALGLIIGIAGGIGTFLGGYLADRLALRDVRWYMWIPGIGFFVAVPTSLGVYYFENIYLILALYAIPAFTTNLYTGPTFGTTQSLAPLAMRASASALLLFIINIIGLVFGPTAVGWLSDVFAGAFSLDSAMSLRWALATCSLVYLISFVNYMLAARHLKADLAQDTP
jgi:MFS family permease